MTFELYCPVCRKKLKDILYKAENGIDYPEKQCPKCKTVYQLLSANETGAHSAEQVILAPRDPRWIEKHKKNFVGLSE